MPAAHDIHTSDYKSIYKVISRDFTYKTFKLRYAVYMSPTRLRFTRKAVANMNVAHLSLTSGGLCAVGGKETLKIISFAWARRGGGDTRVEAKNVFVRLTHCE